MLNFYTVVQKPFHDKIKVSKNKNYCEINNEPDAKRIKFHNG